MAPNDVYPVDYASPVGQVRNLLGDTIRRDDPEFPTKEPEFLFSDAQIQAFIAINRNRLKDAAADAMDAIASNEALVSKKIRTEAGLQTDGPAVANALREHGKQLRAAQRRDDEADDATDAFTEVAFQDKNTWGFNPWA